MLGIVTGANKYVGIINIFETEDKLVYSLELVREPEDLQNMKEARFRIDRKSRGKNSAYNETPT